MADCIAVVNAGSSSVKFGIFALIGNDPPLLRGQVEKIGVAPTLTAEDAAGSEIASESWDAEGFGHAQAMDAIIATVRQALPDSTVKGIGHRVVHGGTHFTEPTKIEPHILQELEKLIPLAPLHQPHNLAPIKAIAERESPIPQVACFDTSFHQSQPPIAQAYAIPRQLSDAGIRRYGFHGLSYHYIRDKLREVAPDFAEKRMIVAHLGNGASLCAMHEGRSVATTMGFTAIEGLMMGTRCGALDPGVILYLLDELGLDARAVENLLYKESGLKGVSGISSDMRELRASQDPRAREAIDLFVYRIVREIGSLGAALGGIEGIVFTGGIGQRDAATRREVIQGCAWLGAMLDEDSNSRADLRIDAESSDVPVWILPTDEERVIARGTMKVLNL